MPGISIESVMDDVSQLKRKQDERKRLTFNTMALLIRARKDELATTFTDSLKSLVVAIDRRSPGEYVSATALICNSAFSFVEFAEQLQLTPEVAGPYLEDFPKATMAGIKGLAHCARVAANNSHLPINGIKELKEAAFALAKTIKELFSYLDQCLADMPASRK